MPDRSTRPTCADSSRTPHRTSRRPRCSYASWPHRAGTRRRWRWSSSFRAELADRYGTDPSPVITQVHLALLRGELASPAPVEAPRRPATIALPAAWRRSATALVGREGDVAAVSASLVDAPLVTIVATGGAGKTRLAAEVARRTAAKGQTVRVLELAGLRSPDEVLPTVLGAFGGADTSATGANLGLDRRVLTPEERLRMIAPDLDGLVVLDNCEHVLDAVATVVADLLAVASPRSRCSPRAAPRWAWSASWSIG